MTLPVIHAYDWSIKTGVAVAARREETGEIATRAVTPISPPKSAAGRHWNLWFLTVQAARWANHVAPHPVTAYYEEAFGNNFAMHSAEGAVQTGLWEVYRTTPFEPNVWPFLAKDWRLVLGLERPVVDLAGLSKSQTAKAKRQARKDQQRAYAIEHAELPDDLTEDEYDAACILIAAELDMTAAERKAAA